MIDMLERAMRVIRDPDRFTQNQTAEYPWGERVDPLLMDRRVRRNLVGALMFAASEDCEWRSAMATLSARHGLPIWHIGGQFAHQIALRLLREEITKLRREAAEERRVFGQRRSG